MDANRERNGGVLTCDGCGKPTWWGSAQVDHRKPLEKGGSNDMDNLQVLCAGRPGRFDCHERKTKRERARPRPPGARKWDAEVRRLAGQTSTGR